MANRVRKRGRLAIRCLLLSLAAMYGVTLLILQEHVRLFSPLQQEWYQTVQNGILESYRAIGSFKKEVVITTHYGNNYTISFAKPSQQYIIESSDLWEAHDSKLPTWMKEYFRWHKEQRANLGKSSHLLVMSCFPTIQKCGGTADRLASMPYMIMIASMFRRVLLIQWGRPAELQEFLLPPRGGVDWRVPLSIKEFVMNDENVSKTIKTGTIILGKAHHDQNLTVLRTVFQAHDKGAGFYNEYRPGGDTELDFYQVFHPVWQVFFTPSPPVAKLIQINMESNNLIPGNYVAVHLRALYNVKARNDGLIRRWAKHGIDCASNLTRSPFFYFASDSIVASRAAVEYGKEKGVVVVGHEDTEPIHLDDRDNWQARKPSVYFGSFLDLYLMSMGHCVAHGIGNYGKFASMMSNNVSCAMQHHYQKGLADCTFQQPSSTILESGGFPEQIFLPPMEDAAHSDTVSPSWIQQPVDSLLIRNAMYPFPLSPTGESIWERSTILPPWAKDYFAWHRQQRAQITKENWKNFRFIVMGCMRTDSKCGGMADRLLPLPLVFRMAAETKRVLFIHWDVPAPLESFLLPPKGGLDWRVPAWMLDNVAEAATNETIRTVRVFLERLQDKDQFIIRARIQSHTHGSDVYNKIGMALGESPHAWRHHFHDLWYTFFTPVPWISQFIEDEMERLDLLPGLFACAHIRALYGLELTGGREESLIQHWTENALNCLTSLRSGPYFVSSDSSVAKKHAIAYGKKRKTRVVGRLDKGEPLHVDLVKESGAKELYPVFVDLYIMSFGEW